MSTVVTRMRAIALAACVAAAGLSAGCAGGPRPAPQAQVRFVVTPDDARVYSDERFIGSARVLARRPASFRAGPRRFTITSEGHFPHDLDVDLAPGETTIEIALRPVPP